MPKNNRHGQSAIISHKEYLIIRKTLKNKHHILLLDLAWYTGERWGAIVQLHVSDVYDKRYQPLGEITFRSAARKASPSGERQTRQVPTHPTLKQELENYQPRASIWLFPNRLDPDRHITREGAAWSLGKAIALAKFQNRGISTHSTRRSCITHLHEAGVDSRLIQEISGHKDLKSLQRYIEISPDRVRNAIALL